MRRERVWSDVVNARYHRAGQAVQIMSDSYLPKRVRVVVGSREHSDDEKRPLQSKTNSIGSIL